MNEGLSRKPYPEARPPHLPDVIARQSPWVLAFGAVAALQVWRTASTVAGFDDGDIGDALGFIASSIQNIAPPLFGVALFLRHRDARTTMPLLVFGLALFAFGELLSAFEEPIRAVLRSISPDFEGQDVGLDSPAVLAFRVFTSLVSIFAILYTAAGLSAARVRERAAAERPLAIWLFALAIVVTVISVAAITQVEFDATPGLLLQLAIGTILSALVTLAWAYLVTVTMGGSMTGELPRRAWGLAALAASMLFATRAAFALLTSLAVGDWALTALQIVGYVSWLAWLLLLAAFWFGLPAPTAASAESVDGDATADPPAATPPGSAAD